MRVTGAWSRGVVHSFRAIGLDVEALCAEVGADIDIFMDENSEPSPAGFRGPVRLLKYSSVIIELD